jgi:DNA-binding MarR family transcriptional regulator
MATTRDPDLGYLLRWAYRGFETTVLERLHGAGYPDLRVPHAAILAWMDEDGTRQATLVERAGLTAQAVSQIIDDLVRRGYLARREAPDDRRAKVIVWTERGRRARDVARGLVVRVEDEYAERLGADAYDAVRRGLAALVEGGPEDSARRPSPATPGSR